MTRVQRRKLRKTGIDNLHKLNRQFVPFHYSTGMLQSKIKVNVTMEVMIDAVMARIGYIKPIKKVELIVALNKCHESKSFPFSRMWRDLRLFHSYLLGCLLFTMSYI